MNNAKKKPQHRTIIYKSYSFIDKDPVIDKLRTIVEDEGESYTAIHDMSGVSTTTLWNWFSGETKRPQYASVMAVARALGWDMQLVKMYASDKPSRKAPKYKSRKPRSEAHARLL